MPETRRVVLPAHELRSGGALSPCQRNRRGSAIAGFFDAHAAGSPGSEAARQPASLRSARSTRERHWQEQLSLVVWTEWPKALPRATGRHRYVVRLHAGFHETLRRLRRIQRRLAGLDGQL